MSEHEILGCRIGGWRRTGFFLPEKGGVAMFRNAVAIRAWVRGAIPAVLAVLLQLPLPGSVWAVHHGAPDKLRLDIKTHFNEKFDLKGIKYGVIYELEESGIEVVESGEDLAVWLEDFSEARTGRDEFEGVLTISITKPTLLIEKAALVQRTIRVRYRSDPLTYFRDDEFLRYMDKMRSNLLARHRHADEASLSDMEKVRAYEIGREAAWEIERMLEGLSGEPFGHHLGRDLYGGSSGR